MNLKTFAVALLLPIFGGAVDITGTFLLPEEYNPTVDMKWANSVPRWYHAMWGTYSVYKFGSDVFGTEFAKTHSVHDILKKGSCGIWEPPSTGLFFGGRLTFDLFVNELGITWNVQGTKDSFRYFRYEFTDNKNFILGVNTYEEGYVGWILLSRTQTLPEATKAKITARLISLGFRKSDIIENPPHCKNEGYAEESYNSKVDDSYIANAGTSYNSNNVY